MKPEAMTGHLAVGLEVEPQSDGRYAQATIFEPASGATNPPDVPTVMLVAESSTRAEARAVAATWPAQVVRIYDALGSWAAAKGSDQRTKFVMFFGMTVEDDSRDDLDSWYLEEHMPALLSVPGWLRIRRYRRVEGPGPDYLAVHELATLGVYQDPTFLQAAGTEWLKRVQAYTISRERFVMRPHTSDA